MATAPRDEKLHARAYGWALAAAERVVNSVKAWMKVPEDPTEFVRDCPRYGTHEWFYLRDGGATDVDPAEEKVGIENIKKWATEAIEQYKPGTRLTFCIYSVVREDDPELIEIQVGINEKN